VVLGDQRGRRWLKISGRLDDWSVVANHGTEPFCLYLWRSVEAPGILYLAKGIESARAVYCELVEDGYIVRAIHMDSDTEYEMREGVLMPVPSARNAEANKSQAAH
jgi:hypothetical protein